MWKTQILPLVTAKTYDTYLYANLYGTCLMRGSELHCVIESSYVIVMLVTYDLMCPWQIMNEWTIDDYYVNYIWSFYG